MTFGPAYAATAPISSAALRAETLPSGKGSTPEASGARLWSIYWQDFGEGGQRPERCHVPGDGQQAVDWHWLQFASALPRNAEVLDMGCGAGTVGRTMLDKRPDIYVTGIDFARVPVAKLPNLVIQQGVRMEQLPFEDGSFDGAVSLFGIEYGNLAQTVRELHRVLKPGGHYSFLVHHHDGEIAREGSVRLHGIRDALSARVKSAFLAGDGTRLDQQRLRLRNQHPDEPTVKLLCDYFGRNVARSSADRQQIWQKLESDVAAELALTAQMVRSAKSAVQLGNWLVPLFSSMATTQVSVLRRGAGEPIGWVISGVR